MSNTTPFIQKLFTSRDNNANSATYVGQEDRIWWDPVTNAFYYSDGTTAGGIQIGGGGGNGSPGGSNTQIQFNNNGSFGGSANLTWNGTVLSVTGNVRANYFIGDGSQLSNIGSSNLIYNGNSWANIASPNGDLVINVGDVTWTYGTDGNLITAGNISANTITANYFYGDGSNISNITGGNITGLPTVTFDISPPGDPVIGDIWIDSNSGVQYLYYNDITGYVWAEMEAQTAYSSTGYANITDNSLNTQVLYNNAGAVWGSNNLTFNGTVLTVGGAVTSPTFSGNVTGTSAVLSTLVVSGITELGNLNITDQTISGTNLNANINITPEGSGVVNLPSIGLQPTGTFLRSYAAVGNANPGVELLTPANADITFAPGVNANILTAGNIMPTGNNIASLGQPDHRYTGLWLGAGNINLIDQGTGNNQQIYAQNGNIVFANSTGASFGNFQFYDDTMALANAASNLIVGTANSTGWVQFNRAIAVSSQTAGTNAFAVDKNGLTYIYTPTTISNTESALNIIGSSSGNSQPRPAAFTGTLLQLTGQDNIAARVSIDAFGSTGAQNSYAAIAARAARGNVDSPTALQQDDLLMRITNQGWTGNGSYAASIARLNFAAAQAFTSNAAVGTYANIQLTPVGSNVIKTVAGFNGNGINFPNAISGGTGNLGITFQDGSFQNTAFATNAVTSVTVGTGLIQNQTTGDITIDNSGVILATGTPQQVRVNGSYTVGQTGNIVLGLPQDIATNSTPTFANLTVTGNLYVVGNTISGNTIGLNGKILYLANNSTSNSDINFGGIALGNVDETYSRSILYDLTNNRWTTAGSANASGIANFYSPVLYAGNVVADYIDVAYTGHFGSAYDGSDFPQADIQAYANINSYSQIINWNKNSGINASTDFVAVNDLGNTTNETNYIDLGINSSTYSNAGYAVSGANDGYLYINGGNLIVGTDTAGNVIKFYTSGSNNVNNIRVVISDTGISAAGNISGNNLSAVNVTSGGAVSATGNVTGQNIYSLNNIGATGAITGQTLVANTAVSTTGSVVGGLVRSTGNISAVGNVIAGNLVTPTTVIDGGVSTTGNVTAGNITVVGSISAGGNITGANIIAAAQIVSPLISVTGNITGGNLITSGLISTTGNATFGNITTIGRASLTGNVDAGNLRTAGTISATGNIGTSGYYLGDGGLLSNITTAAGTKIVNGTTWANIATTNGNLVVTVGGNTVETVTSTGANITGYVNATGNITGSYFVGNGSQLTGIVSSYGNSNVNTLLAAWGSNTVSTTGNITAGYFLGNGSQLTGLNAFGNVYANGTAVLATTGSSALVLTAGNNQIITGNNTSKTVTLAVNDNPTFANVSVTGNITISGNIITGNTTYLSNVGNILFSNTAPLNTAYPGVMEYDGRALYFTAQDQERGIVPNQEWYVLNTDRGLTYASTTPQSLFGVGAHVSNATRYWFRIKATVSRSAGTNNTALTLGWRGSAVLNKITYILESSIGAINTAKAAYQYEATLVSNFTNQLTVTTTSNPPDSVTFIINGIIDVGDTGGGYVDPYISWTGAAAPGSVVVGSLSNFQIYPLGITGITTNVGNWA